MATPYFESFPKTDYKIKTSNLYDYSEKVTDIFFRIGMVREVLNNVASYYIYEVEEGETPEILADRVYGDINAGWMILYANQIFDPQFDWPLTSRQFDKYIAGKYGSIANAKTGIHHYEKIIERTEPQSGITTITKLPLSYQRFTVNRPDAPFDFYVPYLESKGTTVDSTLIKADSTLYTSDSEDVIDEGLPTVKQYETINIDGKTITEVSYANYMTNYDYEEILNDERRTIKIIKAEYYSMISEQFSGLTGTLKPFLRRLPYT